MQGITAVSCIFMVEVTILDYSMKVLAQDEFTTQHPNDPKAATQAFAEFMGVFGQTTNALSFVLSLLGTSMVIRRFGLRSTLILFPTLLCVACMVVYLSPTLEVVFGTMLTLKALSYALNNPCKELLYQPTSTSVKFKAKSWVDIFGQRGAKAGGSLVTNAFADSASGLLTFGMGTSMVLYIYLPVLPKKIKFGLILFTFSRLRACCVFDELNQIQSIRTPDNARALTNNCIAQHVPCRRSCRCGLFTSLPGWASSLNFTLLPATSWATIRREGSDSTERTILWRPSSWQTTPRAALTSKRKTYPTTRRKLKRVRSHHRCHLLLLHSLGHSLDHSSARPNFPNFDRSACERSHAACITGTDDDAEEGA